MKELYLYGNDKFIDKVLNFIKTENLIEKGKIHIVDLLPELKDEYIKDQGIIREE